MEGPGRVSDGRSTLDCVFETNPGAFPFQRGFCGILVRWVSFRVACRPLWSICQIVIIPELKYCLFLHKGKGSHLYSISVLKFLLAHLGYCSPKVLYLSRKYNLRLINTVRDRPDQRLLLLGPNFWNLRIYPVDLKTGEHGSMVRGLVNSSGRQSCVSAVSQSLWAGAWLGGHGICRWGQGDFLEDGSNAPGPSHRTAGVQEQFPGRLYWLVEQSWTLEPDQAWFWMLTLHSSSL